MTEPALREPEQIRQECVRKLRPIETSGMFTAILGCLLGEDWAIGIGVRWGWQASPNEALRLDRIPQVWRWTLILVLIGIGVYLFLWPRSIAS